jgi:ribonucleoside-diphosphate reductase alpha chain
MSTEDSTLTRTAPVNDTTASSSDGVWISKEGGNRRMPFEQARLVRSIQAVHAEFPQLDLADYQRAVLALVHRREQLSADELVDLLIREAESRIDLVAPDW